MSDDPTLDFLASGGVEAAPSSGDSTLDFFTSGGEYHTAPADTRSGSEIVADTEAQTAKSLGAGAEVGLHSTSSKVAGFLGHNAQGGDYPEVRQALTYQPKSEEGQQLQGVVDKAHETIDYPGTWVAKHTGSPELGFATNFVLQTAPFVAAGALANRTPTPEGPPSVSDRILSDSRNAGYVVPPATAEPTLLNRTIEGFAGKANVAQAASIKNQVITDGLARTALGTSASPRLAAELPAVQDLTPESLAASRAPADAIYEKVKGSGPITVDAQYADDLKGLTASSSKIQKDLPNFSSGAQEQIKTLTESMQPQNGIMDAETAVEVSKVLRYEANSNYAASARMGDPKLKTLAAAQQKAAGAVEDLVERHLKANGQPDLASDWDAARVHIAKTYSVQNALDGAGHVDATKLGKQLIKGKPLSDELETAANFANAFPKAARVQPGKESMPGMSPLDVYGSVAASLAAGNPAPMLLGPGRMAARGLALSKAFQPAPEYPAFAPPKPFIPPSGSQ